jgi:hypothetical protein
MGDVHLTKGIAAEMQRCHPLSPTTALKGSGAGNGAPHMVLAANRRACGPRGRRPLGSLGRRHRGLAGCSSNTSGRSSSFEVGWLERRGPCSRCLEQLGTGLQLARLIGTGALTARDGSGDGGAAACGFVPRALAGRAA